MYCGGEKDGNGNLLSMWETGKRGAWIAPVLAALVGGGLGFELGFGFGLVLWNAPGEVVV